MHPSAFRLKKILQYREHQLKVAQMELSSAQSAYQRKEKIRNAMIEERARAFNERRSKMNEIMHGAKNYLYNTYLNKIDRDILQTDMELIKEEADVMAKSEALKHANLKAKTLRVLKEKHQQNYRIWEARREQKELDELILFTGGEGQ